MKVLKVFLSLPYEGRHGEELEEYIQGEITKLKNIFYGYEIVVEVRSKERSSKKAIYNCDICGLGSGWTYIPDCEADRKYAVSEGKPIVITDTEYTRNFIRDYIVGKALKNRF